METSRRRRRSESVRERSNPYFSRNAVLADLSELVYGLEDRRAIGRSRRATEQTLNGPSDHSAARVERRASRSAHRALQQIEKRHPGRNRLESCG